MDITAQWSSLLNADVILLHQVHGLMPVFSGKEEKQAVVQARKDEALKNLETLATKFLKKETSVFYHVTDRSLALSLNELERKNATDFLVFGLKGTSAVKQIFAGSVATKVIEHSNSVSIAVPQKIRGVLPKKLTVAVSSEFEVNSEAMRNLFESLKSSLSQIEFISVIEDFDDEKVCKERLEELSNKFKHICSTSFRYFNGEDVFENLRAYYLMGESDYLVLQKGPRTFDDQLSRKFLVNDLIHDASLPLIIIP